MKIVINSSENYEGFLCESMEIDGEFALCVRPLCECPEDAIIGRDLVSCSDVAAFMKRAYEAGKNGEEFIVEHVGRE